MNLKNQKLNYAKLFFFALLFNFLGYTAFFIMVDYIGNLTYFLILIPLYTGYFILVFISLKRTDFKNSELVLLLLTGLIIRLILIYTDPVLSTDMYRFLWDGKVFAHGINPYSFIPGSQQLEGLRDSHLFPLINSREFFTSQPPLSQVLFLLSNIFGYKIIVWKIILLIFESITVFFLFRLIDHFAMNKLRIVIYFLNPIVILETYSSGHYEVVGVCLLIIAIYYFYKSKIWRVIIAIIFSTLLKYNSLIIALPFLYKKFYQRIFLVICGISISLILFSLKGAMPLAGFISYLNQAECNGFLFKLFVFIFEGIGIVAKEWFTYTVNDQIETVFISAAVYYKIFAFLVLIIVIIDQMKKLKMTADFRGVNYLQSSFIICAAMLILSPDMYPHYLIWIIPFLIILPNWSWLFFTFLIQLIYFGISNISVEKINADFQWILLIIYIPFYSFLLIEFFDRRKIKGWFL